MMEKEQRVCARTVEVRELAGQAQIVGYAAVFNVLSDDLGGFREMIAPGAFADQVLRDVRGLWQHSEMYVLGRTVAGTMELAEDEVGLRYTITPPNAVWARDALESIRRGDVSQSSFAFTVRPDGERWENTNAGVTRIVTRVERLFDVSPVTFPAYPATSVEARNMAAVLRAQDAAGRRAPQVMRRRMNLMEME